MARRSAGLLMYRDRGGTTEVLLVHPGGPFFRNKDDGAWSIPKGEAEPGEDLLSAAQREFTEETGLEACEPSVALTPVKRKDGKVIHAWACRGNRDLTHFSSNTFPMEWPPKSGQQTEFPEADRAEYFDLETARRKINPTQRALIDELQQRLGDTK